MREPYAHHLLHVSAVSFYSAPSHTVISPYWIPQGYEVVEILTAGAVFFEWDGRDIRFERGTIFWHRHGEHTICRTPPEAPYRCLVFHFRVRESEERSAPRVSVWQDCAMLDYFAKEALNAFHHERCDAEQLGDYCYHTLLWQSRRFDRRPAAEDLSPNLRRAIRYLEQHCREPVTVAELAEYARISRPYLFELFKKQLGSSPYQYLLELRMNCARSMLADNTVEIKEIAAQCGFDNLEVFYRAFKRANGMTPGQYRSRNNPYGS